MKYPTKETMLKDIKDTEEEIKDIEAKIRLNPHLERIYDNELLNQKKPDEAFNLL